MKRSTKKSSWNKSILIGLLVFMAFISVTTTPLLLNKVVNKTTKISDYKIISEEVFGLNQPTRILLLFQNNAEARPGGGFIGTVGYLTIDKGKIKPDPVRSVYYYDYEVRKIREASASQGDDVSSIDYTIRDSGQNLDWRANAKAAAKLFELQPGKDVDMVIGVTPEILKFLLTETGPVYLETYDRTISAENVIETLQLEVEAGEDKAAGKDPKTIISEVANKLIERLSEKSTLDLTELGRGMQDLLRQRQITIYSKDYHVAQSINKLGFDGAIINNSGDYFLLTENNLSVDKSNAFIDRKLDRKVVIDESGRVVVSVKITRTQTIPESFPYVDPKAPDIQTFLVKRNGSEIKLALPAGSKLISNSPNYHLTPIGKEQGYDTYGFISSLDPLVPSEYEFSYELPFRIGGENGSVFSSYIQYQNGGWPYVLSQSVVSPPGWEFSASNRNDLSKSGMGVMYTGVVDRDFYWSLIYAKI